jgi:hypothetical protein
MSAVPGRDTNEEREMARLKFPIAALAAGLLLGMAGLTFLAMGGDLGGAPCLARYLHAAEAKLHGTHGGDHHGEDGGHHEAMAQLIEQLELTSEQHRHLERIHELMEAAHHGAGGGSLAELHDKLVAQCADGEVETADLRPVVDEHVEQVRGVLYSITDEFVALVQGLDARQRQILREHLRERTTQDAS